MMAVYTYTAVHVLWFRSRSELATTAVVHVLNLVPRYGTEEGLGHFVVELRYSSY
jgi:hypothetical protein